MLNINVESRKIFKTLSNNTDHNYKFTVSPYEGGTSVHFYIDEKGIIDGTVNMPEEDAKECLKSLIICIQDLLVASELPINNSIFTLNIDPETLIGNIQRQGYDTLMEEMGLSFK